MCKMTSLNTFQWRSAVHFKPFQNHFTRFGFGNDIEMPLGTNVLSDPIEGVIYEKHLGDE